MNEENKKKTLPWTGERYLPNMEGDMQLEHLHRYAIAAEYVKGHAVLDIACGEGYGSAMLSSTARSVFGVDLSAEAVDHARNTYQNDNIEFIVGSCTKIPLPDNSVDSVVSFETIEHHDQHEAMMGEVKRVLKPGGLLIISSPDKHEYSDVPEYHNPFHIKELYHHEFKALLNRYFQHVSIDGQRIIHGSGIFGPDDSGRLFTYDLKEMDIRNPEKARVGGMARAVYLIAIASDAALPKTIGGILEQPVWEGELFRQALAEQTAELSNNHWLLEKANAAIHEKDSLISALQETIVQKEAVISERDQALAQVRETLENLRRESNDKKCRMEGYREELYSVYTSKSWRYTLVLRKAGTLVRRMMTVPHKPAVRAKIKQVYLGLPNVIRRSKWVEKMKHRFKDKEFSDTFKR